MGGGINMSIYILAMFLGGIIFGCKEKQLAQQKTSLHSEMEIVLKEKMLDMWYPRALDTINGGFYSDFNYNWTLGKPQNKFIVTQARHLWTLSKVASRYPEQNYLDYAKHGFSFLKNKLRDSINGGFYTMTDFTGKTTDSLGYLDEKRTYGNAFAIYSLAAYYKASKDPSALNLAKEGFHWIENNAYDSINGGYYQYLTREGKPFQKTNHKSIAYDSIRFPYKDQNTTIHIMEAYAELYRVWPNMKLKKQLSMLLILVRDKITTDKGTMNLFFDQQWRPISYKDSSEQNYALDHVSFGHDIETAFLMLDASDALGIKNYEYTLKIAKKMVDHSKNYGLDSAIGGIYEKGYYFNDKLKVVDSTKNWWSQAEGLNSFSLFSELYPNEKYNNYFNELWGYTSKYFIDWEYGGWHEKGIDMEPEFKFSPKGHIWKGSYHTVRSLLLCLERMEK